MPASDTRNNQSFAAILAMLAIALLVTLCACQATSGTHSESPAQTAEPLASNASSTSQADVPASAWVSIDELYSLTQNASITILDIRNPPLYGDTHTPRAYNIPAGANLEVRYSELSSEKPIYIIGASNDKTTEAWQTLAAAGFDTTQLFIVEGGIQAWEAAGYPMEEGDVHYAC